MGPTELPSRHPIKDLVILACFILISVTLILIFPSPILFVAAISFLALLLMFFNKTLAIALIILSVPITRFPLISQYVGQIKISFFVLVLFIWLVSKNKEELYSLVGNPFSIFFFLTALLMSINILFSIDKSISLNSFFAHLIEFGFFYLFLDTFRDKKKLSGLLFVFFLSGLLTAFIGVMQYLIYEYKLFPRLGVVFLPEVHRYGINFYSTNIEEQLGSIGYRSVGTFYHPNLLGLYLSMVVPMALALMLAKKSLEEKILMLIIITVMIAGIVCSGSRGSLLSVMVSGLFIFIFLRKYMSKFDTAFFIAVPVIIAVKFYAKIIYYLRLYDILSYRDLIWDNALKIIYLHPWAGIGLGTFFKEYISRFGLPSLIDFEITIKDVAVTGSSDWLRGFHAHNLFLNYSAELGLFAIPLFLLFYILFFLMFFHAFKIRDRISRNEYVIIVGSCGVMVGNFIHSFFESAVNFYDFSIGIAFVLIAGMGVSLVLSYRNKNQFMKTSAVS